MDGWEHWQMLTECTWFKPYIARWRQELELKVKARALAAIREAALGTGRNAYSANKILLEGGWKPKSQSTRGRPSKEEIDKQAILEVEQRQKIQKDYERITNGEG